MKFNTYSILLFLAFALASCEPGLVEKSELGPLPSPSFDIVPDGTPNDFVLKNTTDGAFITQWDLGENGTAEGAEVKVNFPFKGDYEITMTTFNRGGSASVTKSLTVTEDDPNACSGNFKLLTGCGEKVWKLAPEANAMHIGPNLNDTWWGNSDTDVTDRACHFDDEYIFRANGEFEYDNKGDFWADSDGGGNIFPPALGLTVGCHPGSDWPAAFKAWDSGVHAFAITNTSFTITGLGAWIGLYKVGTTAEVEVPQASITYTIQEITDNRMVIYADHGGAVWRFTLVSN